MGLNTIRALSFSYLYRSPIDSHPCSEFRVEYLNPPYMSVSRPQLSNVPTSIQFNERFNITVSIPQDLKAAVIQGKTVHIIINGFEKSSQASVSFQLLSWI